jgi:uncharacterized membrane protein
MQRWVSEVFKPAGVGVGVTVLASVIPFVGLLAPAIGGGVASQVKKSGDRSGPRVGLVTGALVVLLSLPMTFFAVAVAATVSPIATVGVLGMTLVGAIYVIGSSALGGYLADELGEGHRSSKDATGQSTPAATGGSASPIERLKRRYVDGEIDDDEFERRLERLVAIEGAGEQAGDRVVENREQRPNRQETTAPARER